VIYPAFGFFGRLYGFVRRSGLEFVAEEHAARPRFWWVRVFVCLWSGTHFRVPLIVYRARRRVALGRCLRCGAIRVVESRPVV